MGHSEGCSMLALEARCLSLVRACGSQGVQNGAISCVALTMSLPGGTRAILAENLIAALARPRGRLRQRRDRLPLPHAPHRQAHGAVPARHRLRDVGLQRHAAPRQHVRRRQLRRRRPGRVDDAAARLAGGRRHRARRRGGRAGGARARRARDPGRLRRARLPARHGRGDRRGHARPLQPRPARPRPRGGRAGGRPRARRAHHRGRRGARARSPRLRRGGRARRRHAAAARLGRLPADRCGDRRRRRGALGRQRPQRLSRPGHRLRARGRPLGAPAGPAARGRPRHRRARRPGRRAIAPARAGRLAARRVGGRGGRRGRPRVRRLAARDDRRHPARGGAAPGLRGHRGGGSAVPRRAHLRAPPTSRSSHTTVRGWRALASPSACNRRAPP